MFESALMSIVSGGATGLLGAAFGHITDYYKAKLAAKQEAARLENQLERRKLDLQRAQMEIDGALRVSQTEGETAQRLAAWKGLSDSYDSDAARYATGDPAKSSGWFILVDVVRGLTRPGVTWYMAALVTYMFVRFVQLVGGLEQAVSHEQMLAIVSQIVNSVLYIATTCTLWWFGVRGKSPGRS